MGNLAINFSYGNWYAFISNVGSIEYKFAGATAEDQIAQVRVLQEAMTQGDEQVISQIRTIFSNVPEGEEQAVVEQMYGGSTELFYEGQSVFEAEEGSTLLDSIVDAGEALAAFI